MRKTSQKQIKQDLANYANWCGSVMPQIEAITVPGAKPCLRLWVAEVGDKISAGEARTSIMALAMAVMSHIHWCKSGLYREVVGDSWIYA